MINPHVRNIFIELEEVRRPLRLKQARVLLTRLARTLHYTVLDEAYHEFAPHAITIVLLLSESHLSLHTWPEQKYAVFEMVSCKAFGTKEKRELLRILRSVLRPKKLRIIVNP